jgi:superfamily I DNA/RNA helicase
VAGNPAVTERLARLQADQRRAATAPPGPVLCVAPAGSGKTTTLVARIAWLIDGGEAPESICAITFNRRAAEELRERVSVALESLGSGIADRVRIRTFHALGLEMLRGAGRPVEPLLDRDELLRAVRPDVPPAERRRLDTLMSRFKLDLDVDPAAIHADPDAGPVARTYAAYGAEIERCGGLDFDDLVARALRLLEAEPAVLAAWRERCAHLLVDEAQDLDRAQLRLALTLAAPENRIFLVGDDDQSIYGWRLADVRRLLGLADEALPNLTRVDLETNYRCPAPVLERAVRLVEHNVERFAKVIRARPNAEGRLVLAPSAADDVDPAAIEADPEAGPVARTFAAYEAEIRRRGGLDFDDLVARSLQRLERDAGVLASWRARCVHLQVDEAQDLDRAQLRLALLLAAPANRIFLVGDDDQSIYGWRLADVRRLLGLADASLPNLTRVDLETNYRCPGTVLERAVRLVEHNTERFAKVIRARPNAEGSLILAPTTADDVDRATAVLRSWPAEGGTRAVLARTNRELVPVAVAALRLGIAFRAPDLVLPVESERVDELLEAARAVPLRLPLLAVGEVRREAGRRDPIAAALLGWSAGFRTLDELAAGVETARRSLAELRRDDAPLSLATAHGTKGLEFDHVAVIGLDEGRFPSARSVAEAVEPDRALEEERRLAYVAWTRARRSLTLVYDPGAPSQFLLEAFSREELAA